MKKLPFYLLFSILLICAACKTHTVESPSASWITAMPPVASYIQPPPAASRPDVPGLIDNFEISDEKWQPQLTPGALVYYATLPANDLGNSTPQALRFDFIIRNDPMLHGRDGFAGIIINKHWDFSRYRGIKFLVRGQNVQTMLVEIHEKTSFGGMTLDEIWYKRFPVQNTWQEVRVNFSEFEVLEYFEQDFVSDNRQDFRNVDAVAFGVDDNFEHYNPSRPRQGSVFIDEIWLY